jgi:hypothetical protein
VRIKGITDLSVIRIGTTKNPFTARTFRTSLERCELICFVYRLFRFASPLFTICFELFCICFRFFLTLLLSGMKGHLFRQNKIIWFAISSKNMFNDWLLEIEVCLELVSWLLEIPAGIGGGDRIRTCGRLRDNGFQDRHHRPLGHPSVCKQS